MPATVPYFRPGFLATPETGWICSSPPGKEHKGLSPGNSTQTCDSVVVPWLTGMGKVTLHNPHAPCLCFQGPVTSADAPTLGREEAQWPQPPLVKTALDEQREPAPLLGSLPYDFSLSVCISSFFNLSNTYHA